MFHGLFVYLFIINFCQLMTGVTKGISLHRVLPHKNYTQHTTIPNQTATKTNTRTQTIRLKLQKIKKQKNLSVLA